MKTSCFSKAVFIAPLHARMALPTDFATRPLTVCCCSAADAACRNNYTFDPFPDLPADFGPEVPDEGIDGLLRVRTLPAVCLEQHDARRSSARMVHKVQQKAAMHSVVVPILLT